MCALIPCGHRQRRSASSGLSAWIAIALVNPRDLPCDQVCFEPTNRSRAKRYRPGKFSGTDQVVYCSSAQADEFGQLLFSNHPLECLHVVPNRARAVIGPKARQVIPAHSRF
jgi:hypothetical protein